MPAQPSRGPFLPGPGQPARVPRVPRRSGRRWLGRGPGHSPGRPGSSAVIKRHWLVPLARSLAFCSEPARGWGRPPLSQCAGGGLLLWRVRLQSAGPRPLFPSWAGCARCPGAHGGRLGARRRPCGAAADGTGLLGPACLCLKRGPWGGVRACTHVRVHGCVVLTAWASGGFCAEANRFALCVSFPTGVPGLLCLARPPVWAFYGRSMFVGLCRRHVGLASDRRVCVCVCGHRGRGSPPEGVRWARGWRAVCRPCAPCGTGWGGPGGALRPSWAAGVAGPAPAVCCRGTRAHVRRRRGS